MLFTRENGAADSCLCVNLPIVGSKWNGKPETHYDTQDGTYWEVMPVLSANELLLQRALLQHKVTGKQHSVLDLTFQLKGKEHVEQSKEAESPIPWRAPGFATGTIAATASSD